MGLLDNLTRDRKRMGLLSAGIGMLGARSLDEGMRRGYAGLLAGLQEADQTEADDYRRAMLEREIQAREIEAQREAELQPYRLAKLQAEAEREAQGPDPYYQPIQTSRGYYRFNARSGQYEPMLDNGEMLQNPSADPRLQAEITAGKEGQKGVKVTDPQGREFVTTQADANPQSFIDYRGILPGLIRQESGGNPNAVSSAGATGLGQFLPSTARDPGYGVAPMRDKSVPEQLRMSQEYLTALYSELKKKGLGDEEAMKGALSAYNQGLGNLQKNGITNQGYVDGVLSKGVAIMGPSLQDKNAAELQKKAQEQQQQQLLGANKMNDALSSMYRYAFPNGQPTTDANGRFVPPKDPVLLGGSPIDRAQMMLHDFGVHSDKASNVLGLRRQAAEMVMGLMNGSLGTGVSNADRDYMASRIGIINSAQDPQDIYNALSDVRERIARIKGAQPGTTNAAPSIGNDLEAELELYRRKIRGGR